MSRNSRVIFLNDTLRSLSLSEIFFWLSYGNEIKRSGPEAVGIRGKRMTRTSSHRCSKQRGWRNGSSRRSRSMFHLFFPFFCSFFLFPVSFSFLEPRPLGFPSPMSLNASRTVWPPATTAMDKLMMPGLRQRQSDIRLRQGDA